LDGAGDRRTPQSTAAPFSRLGVAAADQGCDEFQDGCASSARCAEPRPRSLEEAEAQAYIRGFNRGEKAGFEAAAKTVETLQRALGEGLADLEHARRRIRQQSEREVVELALAIARKVVCREIATSRQCVAAVAREALKKADQQENITVKMNPTDIRFLEKLRGEGERLFETADSVRLEEDDTIESGGCVIETDCGQIDARIDEQLAVIEAAFKREFEGFDSSE
jgi:flagellar assembly protein FliH